MKEMINNENITLIKEVIAHCSKRLSIRNLSKAIWICFGSFVINTQKKDSDLDLMCISDSFNKPVRYVFQYKKLVVHMYVIPTKNFLDDGQKRLYGGYFAGKLLNPYILLYGNKKLEGLIVKSAGEFIGEFAGFIGNMSKNKSYSKNQITAQAFIALLTIFPSFGSYLLGYFLSPNFPMLWGALCDNTIIILKSASIIANHGSRFTYLKRFKDYGAFHEERMKSAARHWSFGAVCHGNDYTFQDQLYRKAKNRMDKIDPKRNKYKEMILFLKKESGLRGVYV